MCRYADNPHKQHYACFSCRRAFKAHGQRGFGFGDAPETSACPECGNAAIRMGRDFKPPRREAKKQWRKVELLAQNGVRFDSCGCTGPGYRPKTLAEAKTFS